MQETLDWLHTDKLLPFTQSVFATKSIDLSAMNLGPADGALLRAWLAKPEVSAAVTELDVSGNDELGARGARALAAALPRGARLKGLGVAEGVPPPRRAR